jgi:cytidylate kinase
MAIITVARGSYSRGKEVAEKLSEALGYECISRDILIEASEEFNIPEIKLVRALHDAPSVLERFHYGKERYISYVMSALLEHVKRDNIVYHGLAGHFFLKDIPHVLKVRIIADINDRVQEEMRRENISAEKARYVLMKDDEERRKWGIQLYGMDTWDSRLYDIVLNIRTLTVDDAVEILCETVRKPAFATTPESKKRLEDLALSTKVQAELVEIFPKVNVTADGGHILINCYGKNMLVRDEIVSKLKTAAEGVEGVTEVTTDMTVLDSKDSQHHVNPFHNIGS